MPGVRAVPLGIIFLKPPHVIHTSDGPPPPRSSSRCIVPSAASCWTSEERSIPVSIVLSAAAQLFLGDTNRTICETPMNMASSRSHCMFMLHIEARKVHPALRNCID